MNAEEMSLHLYIVGLPEGITGFWDGSIHREAFSVFPQRPDIKWIVCFKIICILCNDKLLITIDLLVILLLFEYICLYTEAFKYTIHYWL